jgi:hypothetical protein
MATRRLAAAWTVLLAGPLVWLAALQTNYALVSWACATGRTVVLWLVGGGAMVAVAVAITLAWQASRVPRGTAASENVPHARVFFARVGVALGLGFLLVIVATLLPTFILGPCQ